MWSIDGNRFSQEDVNITPMNADAVEKIQLRAGKVKAKVLRILPLKWYGAAPAIRFALHAFVPAGATGKGSAEGETLVTVLNAMKQSSMVFVGAVEFLSRVDEARKTKAQEEVRRRMDALASEKQALEQTLASEKQTLANEKQGLKEQLDMCTKQLRETENLFRQEQAVREQFEGLHSTLEKEKSDLQDALQKQVDENNAHQNELLKLQSSNTKNELLIETLKRQLKEQEDLVTQLQSCNDEHVLRAQHLEAEKEDLENQIIVLKEERDLARANEEDLTEKVRVGKEELEELQDSYVSTTERLNDYKDEVMELSDKLEEYKAAMKQKEALTATRFVPQVSGAQAHLTQSKSLSSSLETVPTGGSPNGRVTKLVPTPPATSATSVTSSDIKKTPPPAPAPEDDGDEYGEDGFDD